VASWPATSDRAAFVGEAEAYALLTRAGLHPPRHAVVGGPLPFTPGEPVVLKGLGEELWHKSELGAVAFLPFDVTAVGTASGAMRARVEAAGHRWLGGLVCERVAIARAEGLPSEGFFSLTHGEAGWVALCGFGGLQAEALAAFAPPLRWPLALTTPAEALAELRQHLLGRIWLGELRGTRPLTTERQLGALLAALWVLAALAGAEGLADTPEAFAAFDWALHKRLTQASGIAFFVYFINNVQGLYALAGTRYFEHPEARAHSRAFYAELRRCAEGRDAAAGFTLLQRVMFESRSFWLRFYGGQAN